MTGTIKFFNNMKGFGFVTSSDGKDYFFPYGSLSADLQTILPSPGDRVTFELVGSLDREMMASFIKREESTNVEEPNVAGPG